MVAQEFTVDLNKPLVFQVGHLGESYQELVHQPIPSREVVCWFVSMSLWMGLTIPHVALLHPMDGLRLVFLPAAAAVLCVPFWNLVKLFATPLTAPALFGGGLLGYVIYDVAHYYLHHG
nr:dihydroceramide fatty acyl 2-hydroxylase FAH1-like [Ipomoea batatas]